MRMKKLYAFRDKKTGQFVVDAPIEPVPGEPGRYNNDDWGLSERFGLLFINDDLKFVQGCEKEFNEQFGAEIELVTLRIEPTEPCEWCGDDIGGSIHRPNNGHEKAWRKDAVRVSLGYYHFNFCPNCGRSLT